MALEFDHLFIFTAIGAPEANRVLAIGLTEGTSSIHPGQGTSNRRIFFHNAMLEFLWIHDEREAQNPVIAPTHLWERSQYRETGYSPFGVGLRCVSPKPSSPSLPFESWAYRPPYLPSTLQFDVASHTIANEPMIFVIPFEGTRPDTLPPDRAQPLHHAIGFREITNIHIQVPSQEPFSTAIRALHAAGLITFKHGTTHLTEIEFDHGTQGHMMDFQPALPLRMNW